MGTSKVQGDLWGQAPSDWAFIQEPQHNPLFEAMLHATKVGTDTRFFDAGCGGGAASVLAAQRGAQVSGLDAALGLIEIARQRIPSGDFRVGDMQDLPFEDNVFDVVFAANSLQYTADRVATLRELRRVCAPEGRVTIGIFGLPETVAFRVMQEAVRNVLPEPPQGKGPYELSVSGRLEGLFKEAGLQVLNSGEVDCPFAYPDFETYWRGNSSAGPFQAAIRAVGEDKLRKAAVEAIEIFRIDDGSFYIAPNIFKYIVTTAEP